MQIILFNKPYRVLSQFSRNGSSTKNEHLNDGEPDALRQTLADYIDRPDYYPAGRLDFLSEGLLLLTDNGQLQHRISAPEKKLPKSYWVQGEGSPSPSALRELAGGVMLRDGLTHPAQLAPLMQAPPLWRREPPLATHREASSQWLGITLREGKNRQIRRMLASVGHPVLRLVRHRIGHWQLGDLQPGQSRLANIHLPRSNNARRAGQAQKKG